MIEKLNQMITDSLEVVKTAERYRYIDHCVVIGRGFNYSTAFEIALKGEGNDTGGFSAL